MKNNFERIQIILNWLKTYSETTHLKLDGFYYAECGYKKPNEFPSSDSFTSFKKSIVFKGNDGHMWLYKKVALPGDTKDKNIYLKFKTDKYGWDAVNPQFMVYIDGRLVQALDVNHTTVSLKDCKKEFELMIYGYSGIYNPGVYDRQVLVPEFTVEAEIAVIDPLIEKLYYDIKVPLEVLEYSEENTADYTQILKGLTEIINLLDFRMPRSREFYQSLERASEYADKEFYGKICKKSMPQITCIGHTHIDIAWLWSVAQTREKAQRSFATVINLMKQYPKYTFMSSQAILYKIVKEEAPELYAEIKKAIIEGRWEVEGSMWVESDCNLISGESLVRQILHGKNFFLEEFGIDTKIVWLPDVFGYSAAMPQIMKKSGVEKFVTSKISWNDVNKMPYDVFMWKGIDGTEIFSYFLTAQDKIKGKEPANFTTYVGIACPKQAAGAWDRFQQKEITSEVILTHGYGDGGGGPNAEFIENIKRMEYGIPGCPTAVFDTATNFLNRVETDAAASRYFPKWAGELYLEFHRGTYTSQAANKKNNRKIEFSLINSEMLSVLAGELLKLPYPKSRFKEAWETVLTNQFHDIIPGTSISEVYRVTDMEYDGLFKLTDSIWSDGINALKDNIKSDGGYLVFNSNAFNFSGNVELDGKCCFVENIPAKGYKVCGLAENKSRVKLSKNSMENDYYVIKFDKNYNISSIFCKEYSRELIKKDSAANVLRVYEDLSGHYDAWELRSYHKEKFWDIDGAEAVELVDEGARAGIKITKRFLTSTITQTIYLYNSTKRVDFKTELDWTVEHVVLKTLFPVEINSQRAVYDIQFGSIERNTHSNTSWDRAQFEVCAHKYVDFSEGDFGIALLNDCKYGHSIKDGVMSLTLLKCATYPDPDCDKGKHEFTYSLFAHGADKLCVIKEAYDLNNPMKAVKIAANNKGVLPESYSLIHSDADNVIIETVKQAEKTGDTVVRLYECANRQTETLITLGFKVKSAYLADLMENKQDSLEIKDGSIALTVKPFEIVTLLLQK